MSTCLWSEDESVNPTLSLSLSLSVLFDDSLLAVLNQGVNIRLENEQGGFRTGFRLFNRGTAGQVFIQLLEFTKCRRTVFRLCTSRYK
jgi:hypothetical protein